LAIPAILSDMRDNTTARRPGKFLKFKSTAYLAPILNRRHIELPFECTVECCLRCVADIGRDLSDALTTRLQQSRCELQAPSREIRERMSWMGMLCASTLTRSTPQVRNSA
jgi:hypothetical protein